MEIIGIICEYNPLHLGHRKQIAQIRQTVGPDCGIVCLMSGDYVQRGAPAIVDKTRRAEAAVRCGADLVLELPVTCSLSSAEGFAAGGVGILSGFCDSLCFGAETADSAALMDTARALLSPDFPQMLRQQLDQGLSFPAARQGALEAMGIDASLLRTPNNILAIEYCKAILFQGVAMKPMVIHRPGSYHDTAPDPENPSATALRKLMTARESWEAYIPEEAASCFADAPRHTLAQGERAILYRLRTMTDAEFEALPYGSEGLWRKFMHAARKEPTVEDILTAAKSKRYTRSRLDRMLMCAFLGITREDLETPPPYTRVLALNDRGRTILKKARQTGHFPNIGQVLDDPYQALENRCGDLYGLFSDIPEAPGRENDYRIYYHR
ncbi:MAG: nucleotidyltransferase family protein [Oscillospiraceae bacterium]|nr:nucleotidyltransferase family protein [Oscillospiraceae bacterium]